MASARHLPDGPMPRPKGRGFFHGAETHEASPKRGLWTLTISRLLRTCHRSANNLPSSLGLKARKPGHVGYIGFLA